ncbi:AraC family transcriptional regulator [Lunatibacter salilacus]|uniref:AraC family transcriptional regulator n=1 Tax=Lunatibacter salilacus TaxID=2483804 RepID=UPI0037436AED
MNEKSEPITQQKPFESNPTASFTIQTEIISGSHVILHHHPEIEIVQINQGEGQLQVGNLKVNYTAGNVFILGPNLSHCWHISDIVEEEMNLIHFSPEFWGKGFLNLPENNAIKKLLNLADCVIKLPIESEPVFSILFDHTLNSSESSKIIGLLEILILLSKTNGLQYLLKGDKHNTQDHPTRLPKIEVALQYIQNKFKNTITLREVAALLTMNQNYFCRYFKSQTGKTFVEYLTEIRVRHACSLILEKKMNLKQICSQSGFNNMTSFHKAFKKITKTSPLEFQKEHLNDP